MGLHIGPSGVYSMLSRIGFVGIVTNITRLQCISVKRH